MISHVGTQYYVINVFLSTGLKWSRIITMNKLKISGDIPIKI